MDLSHPSQENADKKYKISFTGSASRLPQKEPGVTIQENKFLWNLNKAISWVTNRLNLISAYQKILRNFQW